MKQKTKFIVLLKSKKHQQVIFFLLLFFSSIKVTALTVESVPHEISSFESSIKTGQVHEDQEDKCKGLKIKIRPVCHHHVENRDSKVPFPNHFPHPISPWARLKMHFKVRDNTGTDTEYTIKFPARYALREPETLATRLALCRPVLRDICNATQLFTSTANPNPKPVFDQDGGQQVKAPLTFAGNCDTISDDNLYLNTLANNALQTTLETTIATPSALPGVPIWQQNFHFLNLWALQQHCYTDTNIITNPAYYNKCENPPSAVRVSTSKPPLRLNEVTFRKPGVAGDLNVDYAYAGSHKEHGVNHLIRVDTDICLKSYTKDAEGDFDTTVPGTQTHLDKDDDFHAISFNQDFDDDNIAPALIPYSKQKQDEYIPASAYMGKPGPVDFKVLSKKRSNDGNEVEIRVSFPASPHNEFYRRHATDPTQDLLNYCESYYSPLMLFFDKARPNYTASANVLSLSGTYWPEKNSPGYFLGYSPDGIPKVQGPENLFTDLTGQKNGFELLHDLAKKKKGQLTNKDPIWNKLFLWQDRNANGEVDLGEINTLETMGIASIKLDYKVSVTPIGNRAKEKGDSSFEFKDKKGNKLKGKLIDVWFAPFSGT